MILETLFIRRLPYPLGLRKSPTPMGTDLKSVPINCSKSVPINCSKSVLNNVTPKWND